MKKPSRIWKREVANAIECEGLDYTFNDYYSEQTVKKEDPALGNLVEMFTSARKALEEYLIEEGYYDGEDL